METRVQKYKNYRGSLIKEGTNVYRSDTKRYTTNTLPLDEVMTVANKENEQKLVLRKKKEKIVKYTISGCILVLLIVGVVLLGVYLFR